jgi:hypothetical protein
MDTHIKVLGWLYIVLGVLGILAAVIVFIAVFGGGLLSGDQEAITVTAIVGTIVAGIILLLSLPGVIVGAGLLRFRPWARVLALVLGILNLPGFPVGTILGVYSLWALLTEEGARYFEPGVQAAPAG